MRRGWRRRIWRPTWCASSPSCRARWAASTRAKTGEPEAVWKAIYFHYLPHRRRSRRARRRRGARAAAVTWAACLAGRQARHARRPVHRGRAADRARAIRSACGARRTACIRILLDAERADRRARAADARWRSSIGARRGYGDAQGPTAGVRRCSRSCANGWSTSSRRAASDSRNVRAVLDRCRSSSSMSSPTRRTTSRRCRSSRSRSRSGSSRRPSNACATSRRTPSRATAPAARQSRGGAARSRPRWRCSRRSTAARPDIDKARRTGQRYREAYAEASQFEPAVARFFNDVFVMADDAGVEAGAAAADASELEQLILQLGDISEIVATES